MDELGISFWFVSGTALGLYRDGAIIEGDCDIDFEIWHSDSDKLIKICEEFERNGFQKVSSAFYKNRCEAIGWEYKQVSCDVSIRHRKGHAGWVITGDNTPHGWKWIHKIHPAHMFNAPNRINALGLTDIPIPAFTDEYLRMTYGESWKTPQLDFWKKNGFYSGRECVVTEDIINKDIP